MEGADGKANPYHWMSKREVIKEDQNSIAFPCYWAEFILLDKFSPNTFEKFLYIQYFYYLVAG